MSLSLYPGLIGFHNGECGVVIALSTDERYLLFLSRESQPVRWIDVGAFILDPVTLSKGDDVNPPHAK